MTKFEMIIKSSGKVAGAIKKAASTFLALTLVMSLGLTSLAVEENPSDTNYDYYVKETNSDNTDPVYILLDESNSTVNEETGDRVLKDEKKDPLKIYSEVEKIAQETKTVYQITSEETQASKLNVGETYSFIEGDGAKIGDVLDAVPEGGAELEYLGDGKTQIVTTNPAGSKSSDTAEQIFQSDVAMVESGINNIKAYTSLKQKYDAGLDPASDNGAALTLQVVWGSYGYYDPELIASLNTIDKWADFYAGSEWDYMSEEYRGGKTREQYIEDNRQTYIGNLKEESSYYAGVVEDVAKEADDIQNYEKLLAEMKAVNENDKLAILEYLGMTEEQMQYVKGNMCDSNTPVRSNSGFVSVVKKGTGFDDCPQGAIFYDEDLGWSYACTNGGVAFGEASDLHLYKIDEKEIEPDAFKVQAGDTVQLNKDGTGVAGLSNVKAYCTIGGEDKEIIAFEFVDDYVDLNDCHVTAKVGGRYFTVTLNLKEWIDDPTPYIPIEDIEPIDEPEETTPAPAPKTNEVKTDDFVVTQKTVNNAKIDGQSWYGYQFEPVFEKKEAKAKDVTDYLDKCIARGKELITFTPSGLDTAAVTDLGAALSKVTDKEKVKGLDFSSVTINEKADLSNAFAGYTSLEIIDVSNWRVYNGTFEKAGLASGAGQNIFYYNDLTNKEYIDKLEALGWVGKHENLDLSNWIDIDPSFIEWAGLAGKKTFTYNAATAQAYIDYLTALGWTGINESAG